MREKNQYGSLTLKEIEKNCIDYSNKNNINLSFVQSNIEGELVSKIQDARKKQDESLLMLVDTRILL